MKPFPVKVVIKDVEYDVAKLWEFEGKPAKRKVLLPEEKVTTAENSLVVGKPLLDV